MLRKTFVLLLGVLWWTGLGLVGVQADDRSDILREASRKGIQYDSLRVSSGWALGSWSEGDGGGITLLRKENGRWQTVLRDGGAIDVKGLYQYGVPRSALRSLLSHRVSDADIRAAVSQGPFWKELSTQDLDVNDLRPRSSWILSLMRNEVYARHGRPFRDPALREYFAARSWYRADPSYSDARLTPLEKRNVDKIAEYERRQKPER